MLFKLRQMIWQWRGVLIAAPCVTSLVIILRVAGLLQTFEWAALDQFFCLRGREPVQKRIVIVQINESDIRKYHWPISDDLLSQLLEKIKTQKPRVIGLDLYRDLPVPPGHQALVRVFESTPNLIGIQKVLEDANSSAVDPPPALSTRKQVGANDLVLDGDGKVRRSFISLKTKDKKMLFGFGMQLALIDLQAEGVNPQSDKENKQKVHWGKAVFLPFKGDDGGYVRAAYGGGYQILINFQGPARSFPTISMTDVLENRIPPDLIRDAPSGHPLQDRIVLIGTTAESLKDIYYTPYSSNILGIPERMSGVEIHANLISQILNATLLGRPQIKTWPKSLEWLWIFGWSLVGATLTWAQRYTGGTRERELMIAASILLPGGVLIGSSYLAFVLGGWWIPVIPAILSGAGSGMAIVSYTARTAGEIRKTFGRYLTAEVVSNLLETPEGLKLGGQRKKVTIMMTDLRGFSAVSERLPPETVVTFLNVYLGAMADVITQYNGTIDEFIGDAILVIFGAPQAREDDAQRSVACAVAMQLAMDAVNEQIKQFDMPKLEMGIGINTGEVVVGNIGSAKRAKYGVVGNHVNLTGRIESYTVGGQILISEYTLREAGDVFRIDGEIQVAAKGIKQPVTLYDVTGVYGSYNIFLPKKEDNLISLKEAISIEYTVLDGKHVVGAMLLGSLVKVSETGGELVSEHSLAPLSNIKINLLTGTNKDESRGDLYAKVMRKSDNSNTGFSLRFTAVPPDVAAMLSELVLSEKEKSDK